MVIGLLRPPSVLVLIIVINIHHNCYKVRTGGYILSSLMLIVLSIDRWGEQGLKISTWQSTNLVLENVKMTISNLVLKHCQTHNGPEGWVHITNSYTNLDQIPKFKMSTTHQHFDQTLTSKSWPNNYFITSPSLHTTVVKTFLIINISNSNNLNKFWVGIFTSHTSHQSSLLNRSESVS